MLTPSFRKRIGVVSSTPTSVLTAMPTLPFSPSYVEDKETSPPRTDLRPQKMKATDGGAYVLATIDLFEDDVVL